MASSERIIAPQRPTTALRGRRYLLRAPIDFTVLTWMELMRDYDAFAGAGDPAEINERLLLLMPTIFYYGQRRPVWRNALRRLLRRPVAEVSGPDARTIMSWTFGERLQALQDFTTALSVCGVMMTTRPAPPTPMEGPDRR